MLADLLIDLQQRLESFQGEAHDILAATETSQSRIVQLTKTQKAIQGLSIKQADLLEEALRCISAAAFRSSYVTSWAAYMDLLEEKLAEGSLISIHQVRPAWTKYPTLDDLREGITEYQLIDAARDVKLLSKNEAKLVHGLLARRNECAHPSSRPGPGLNESLGFVSEIVGRIQPLLTRSIR